MIAVGLAATWLGYTSCAWGYCLIRGYDVTFVQLFKGTWPGTGKTAAAGSAAPAAAPASKTAGGVTQTYNRPGAPAGASNVTGSRL